MSQIQDRKRQHIDITLTQAVEPNSTPIFDQYKLPYSALPEIDMSEIDTTIKAFGFQFSFPFFISSMTGGEKYGRTINENIARACEAEKVGFGLGSMRVLKDHPEAKISFDVKKFCPSVPMFANLGLVQLNYGFGYDEIMFLVDSVKADGIFFHINHLQEAIQPEGDVNYKGLIPKLAKILSRLKIPIIVKEVGHGIDFKTAKRLQEIGVEWIDVSGTGGTSWAWIEGYRRLKPDEEMNAENLGYIFRSVGISTPDCLVALKKLKNLKLIAGGGIRNGLDLAKSIAMGAKMGTAAKPFLKATLTSSESVAALIQKLKHELVIAMFSVGIKDLRMLNKVKLITN